MKKWIKILIFLIFVILCMIGIFKLSEMTGKKSGDKSTGMLSVFIEDTLDITNEYGFTNAHPSDESLAHATELINKPLRKVAHASEYFLLAFLIMIFLNIVFNHKKYLLTVLIAIILCVGYAASDEYHQTFVKGRVGNPRDVAIDSTGACIGILFYSTYHMVYKMGYKSGKNQIKEEKKVSEDSSN